MGDLQRSFLNRMYLSTAKPCEMCVGIDGKVLARESREGMEG